MPPSMSLPALLSALCLGPPPRRRHRYRLPGARIFCRRFAVESLYRQIYRRGFRLFLRLRINALSCTFDG